MRNILLEFGADTNYCNLNFPHLIKCTNGNEYYHRRGWFPYNFDRNVRHDHDITRDGGIYFGTGDTPATYLDYILTNQIRMNAGFTGTVNSILSGVNPVTGNPKTDINITLNNSMVTTDLVIKEVGYVVPEYVYTQPGGKDAPSQQAQEYRVLVDHTVLDTALVIPPNSSVVFKYTFELNYTPASGG